MVPVKTVQGLVFSVPCLCLQGLSLSDVPPSTELSKHTRQPGENHDFAAEKVVPVEPKVPTTPPPPQAAGAAVRPTMQPGAAAAAAVAAAGTGAAAQGPVPPLGVLPSVQRAEPEQKPAAGTLQGAASGVALVAQLAAS